MAELWWIMLAGACIIFLLVMALLALAFTPARRYLRHSRSVYLIGGGLIFPAVVLSVLLAYALITGERLLADPARPAPMRVQAVAAQWQWTFRYPGGEEIAGRLVLPVGQPVDIALSSEDVIHSFWIPRLGGKIDAVPGRIHVVRLMADRPGIYAGACAEFCGIGHSGMYFSAEAVAAENYDAALRQVTSQRGTN